MTVKIEGISELDKQKLKEGFDRWRKTYEALEQVQTVICPVCTGTCGTCVLTKYPELKEIRKMCMDEHLMSYASGRVDLAKKTVREVYRELKNLHRELGLLNEE